MTTQKYHYVAIFIIFIFHLYYLLGNYFGLFIFHEDYFQQFQENHCAIILTSLFKAVKKLFFLIFKP